MSDIQIQDQRVQSSPYKDGYADGEEKGKEEGYTTGLNAGRQECRLQRQEEEAEKQRQAEIESRRLFWDSAYFNEPKVKAEEKNFDIKGEATKAETNLKAFIPDVSKMTQNEFLATEQELVTRYAAKQEDYKHNHKWWQVLSAPPESPMKVNRSSDGAVTSVQFPSQGYVIPVTYWNSQTEATKIKALTSAMESAPTVLDKNVAQKALSDELATLKLPQIAQVMDRLPKQH